MFGQDRSKRYVLTVENGKVKDVFVEPDNTGVNGMHRVIKLSIETMYKCWLTLSSVYG